MPLTRTKRGLLAKLHTNQVCMRQGSQSSRACTRKHPMMKAGAGRVAPCALQYPGSAQHLAAAGLGAENGLWRGVHDFCWLRATPSPNW